MTKESVEEMIKTILKTAEMITEAVAKMFKTILKTQNDQRSSSQND